MSSTSSPAQAPKSTSSGFSTFLPRFKTKETSAASLSPTKPAPSSPSTSRRGSVSDGTSLCPKPSPALSTKSSFSDFKWATSRRETSAASDSTARRSVLPPKLTLTQDGSQSGDSGDMISLHAPSPQNMSGPSFAGGTIPAPAGGSGAGREGRARAPQGMIGFGDGLARGWSEDENDLSTPTATEPYWSTRGQAAPSTASSRASSISNPIPPPAPDLPRQDAETLSTVDPSSPTPFLHDSSLSSHQYNPPQHRPHLPSSQSQSSTPLALETTSSKTKSNKKITGIAGAIAVISRDLVSPGQGLLSSSSQATPRASNSIPASPTTQNVSQSRTRSGTGDSSSAASQSSSRRRSSISLRSKHPLPASPSSSNALLAPARPVSEARTSVDHTMRPALGVEGDQSDSYDSYGDDLDEESGSDCSEEEGELDGLPAVTGFAVASQKRNADFHALFGKAVPEDDYLIEDYGCALQRDILLQGRLYVSEHHIAFHANIFGWITNLVIAFADIRRIDKKMTAFVIPNAIMITSYDAKHTFASFLSRDTTYDVVFNIWRISHPSATGTPSSESLGFATSSTDQPPESIDSVGDFSGSRSPGGASAGPKKAAVKRKATECACGKAGQHFSETAMDTVFPSTPEKIYNLMFESGFAKTFMSEDQKLMDIQISDWAPASSGSNLLTRKSSYIKPLAGGFGPKQTKCELEDVTAHADFEDYVSMVTTTRTPDVPSGGVFSVKTRTCLTWASAGTTRVLVTTEVQWTGRSFIKGIIDSSALAGQKSTHAALESAIRIYITDHVTEFHVEGLDNDEPDPPTPANITISNLESRTGGPSSSLPPPASIDKLAQKAVDNGTFFQYGVDSLTKGTKQLLDGLVAICESGFSSLGLHGAFAILIAMLLVSNVWTYISLQASRVAPRQPIVRSTSSNSHALAESPSAESVADAVRGFLEDYFERQPVTVSDTQDPSLNAISQLELRITTLERRLTALSPAAESLEGLD